MYLCLCVQVFMSTCVQSLNMCYHQLLQSELAFHRLLVSFKYLVPKQTVVKKINPKKHTCCIEIHVEMLNTAVN